MSADASELNATIVLKRITSGELPRESVLLVARGLLPFAQEELVSIVSQLARHEDEEIAATALATLRDIPPAVLISCARNTEENPESLDALALVINDSSVLEAIARNRATPDETLLRLAGSAGANLQEIILVNQERLLRTPALVEALLGNASLSVDVRRRALEFQDEFFVKRKAQFEAIPIEFDSGEPLGLEEEELMIEMIEQAEKFEAAAVLPSFEDVEEKDADKVSLWSRIGKMNVAQKVQIAFKAGPTERGILIRDRNKMVCTAVIRSPKITDSEAEAYAGLRNVDEEVLRQIGNNRHAAAVALHW